MRLNSIPASATAALLGVALFAVIAAAQAPPPSPGPGDGGPHQPAPAPTNLKVLPKTLTGDQVHEIMHKWRDQLGVECDTCHTVDPNRKMPNGHPALNFADDSKPEKETARLMVKMTGEINQNYTSMVKSTHSQDESAKVVSCGTCHQGHLDPPAFVPPPEHEHGHHDGAAC